MLGSVMELPATDKQTVPLNTTPQPLSLTSTLLFVGSAALQGPMCYTRRATSAMQNELWRYASLWCGQSGRLAAKCGLLASLKVHNPTQLRNYSLVLITSTNLLLACSSEPQGGPPLLKNGECHQYTNKKLKDWVALSTIVRLPRILQRNTPGTGTIFYEQQCLD